MDNMNTAERAQEQELEEYSITNGSDYNSIQLFYINMCAILRKKILM